MSKRQGKKAEKRLNWLDLAKQLLLGDSMCRGALSGVVLVVILFAIVYAAAAAAAAAAAVAAAVAGAGACLRNPVL